MSQLSKIEWTDATWSPVVGCTRVSAGCDHCYAVRQTRRLEAMGQAKYAGLVNAGKGHFNGTARLHAPILDWPLRWRGAKAAKEAERSSRIFVNPMSDLFHERLSDEAIAAVFGVMAACQQHTFQVLTKRPELMRRWFEWLHNTQTLFGFDRIRYCAKMAHNKSRAVNVNRNLLRIWDGSEVPPPWPLPNVWLGVSVEDQATADARIPLLLQTPAALRFVSYEPALGPVDFTRWLRLATMRHVAMSVEGAIRNRAYDCLQTDAGKPMTRREAEDELLALHARGVKLVPAGDCEGFDPQSGCPGHRKPRLDWLIVGGESGPGARPFDLAWARSAVAQCREASVPMFVKQLGRRVYGPVSGALVDRYILRGGSEWRPPIVGFDRERFESDNADQIVGFKPFSAKGGHPSEWPEDLRVREFPA